MLLASMPNASPAEMPAAPPMRLTSSASIRNCRRMSDLRAPSAFLMPISRVRSVTDTSITFITPMPATTSEMLAMPTSMSVMVWLISLEAFSMSSCDTTANWLGDSPLSPDK